MMEDMSREIETLREQNAGLHVSEILAGVWVSRSLQDAFAVLTTDKVPISIAFSSTPLRCPLHLSYADGAHR